LSSWVPFFELATRLYEVFRLAAKLLSHGNQVWLVGFEETQQGGEKRRVVEPRPQLLSPDSGQVEEPLRPTFVAERCGKRSECKRDRIIWYPDGDSLECSELG
jgi:hypothetical protein